MLVKYRKTGKVVNLRDKTASVLVKAGLADYVQEAVKAEPEISERTGLPKRQYNRRDMKADS